MRRNKWFGVIISTVLLLSFIQPIGTFAESKRSLQDESIYDLLVDRFNNGNYENDEKIDLENMSAFMGGDFAGITSKLEYFTTLGFTLVSVGPVFSTATYDGNEVLDYGVLEPSFGTSEEFIEMIDVLNEKNIGVIADFPLNGVSENHVWVKEGSMAFHPNGDGTVNWDLASDNVKKVLMDAVVSFVEKYDLSGIRLTQLGDVDDAVLNDIIAGLKEVDNDLYVLSNEASTADFDTVPNIEKMHALQQGYVQMDPETAPFSLFEDKAETDLIQFDDLMGTRFTYEMFQLRMFPPTRWKIAATALFTLPGVPIMPYGSEIAVNGKEAPESHPVSNFKTDMELYEYISDLNSLRNQSETLRNGDFKLLHNEDGFTVFTRTSEDETWVIALNNSSETASLEISEELIGDNKRLRGLLDGDMIRQSKDGKYRLVLERELTEIYIADEDKGFNTLYLIASILIYSIFLAFLLTIWRRGKKQRQASAK